MNRKDRRSNRGRLRSSRARHKWRYIPSISWRYRRGVPRLHFEGHWEYVRFEPVRPRNCRRGPVLKQMRRLEQKQVRREGQRLIRDELEWMAYERLLHEHAHRFFEPKPGNVFHQDVETYTQHTLCGWELLDIEYERRYQEDMLTTIAELRDGDDHLDDDADDFLDAMRDSYSPQHRWVEGFNDEFSPPDPWDDYPYEEEEEDESFDGEDEFFAEQPTRQPVDTYPHLLREQERIKASIRQHYPYRRR